MRLHANWDPSAEICNNGTMTLNEVVLSICEDKSFVTQASLISKQDVSKGLRSYLKPEDPPPKTLETLIQPEQLKKDLGFIPQHYMRPSENAHYERIGPNSVGRMKNVYNE